MVKIRWLSNLRYPKLLGLACTILLAYFIFSNAAVQGYVSHLNNWGYFGAFFAGILFTFGFTSPISAGMFLVLNPENIWLAGILGGFGAMLGDIFIFQFVRFSFMDEFKRLKKTKILRQTSSLIDNFLGPKIKVYLMYAFAGIIIASPLPDEAGVLILAGITKIKIGILAILGFILNTLGILLLLML
jgi:hypothetical protein